VLFLLLRELRLKHSPPRSSFVHLSESPEAAPGTSFRLWVAKSLKTLGSRNPLCRAKRVDRFESRTDEMSFDTIDIDMF